MVDLPRNIQSSPFHTLCQKATNIWSIDSVSEIQNSKQAENWRKAYGSMHYFPHSTKLIYPSTTHYMSLKELLKLRHFPRYFCFGPECRYNREILTKQIYHNISIRVQTVGRKETKQSGTRLFLSGPFCSIMWRHMQNYYKHGYLPLVLDECVSTNGNSMSGKKNRWNG